MKTRKRLKLQARQVKAESTFVDFDDGESVQIPLFLSRINRPDFDVGKVLGELATSALAYDMCRKGMNVDADVVVRINTDNTGKSIIDWAKEQPGALVDDYQ